jgi:hypothetical protein
VDAERAALAERVRTLLAGEPSTREVAMFGGLAFMVDDRMVVSSSRGGDLLVRVPRARDDELVALPGASRPEMGAGRSMGPGWVSVAAEALTDDEELSFWVGVARAG